MCVKVMQLQSEGHDCTTEIAFWIVERILLHGGNEDETSKDETVALSILVQVTTCSGASPDLVMSETSRQEGRKTPYR